jgi:aryl-alcohol dehydrogenase-like predicted oxidoreductase
MTAGVPRVELAPGYTVSRIIKGGWQLAGGHGAVDEASALDDMERFVDAGVTTFDCADIYTGVESLIGRYLRRLSARFGAPATDRVQVHTKYVPDLDQLAGLRKKDVEQAVDRSLMRLGVDRLDLVQFHWWDYGVDGYVDAARWLDDQRRAGKIRHIGVTNFDVPHLRALLDAGIPVVSHQLQYSVLDRRPTHGMADACAATGIRLLCYGTLAGGFLSARYLREPPPSAPLENRSLVKYRLIIDEFGGWDRFQQLLTVLEAVARRHGVGPGAVATRWVLDRPQVSAAIIGVRHPRHLDDLGRVFAITLTDEDRASIDAVQANAAGPAGDVYGLERVKGGPHASIMRYTLNADGGERMG